MEKLKPCPFCGGSDIDIRTDDGGLSWYSFCNDCGVMCGYSMTKDDVINAWNRRAERSDAERLNAIADELDKAMKDYVIKTVPLFKEAAKAFNKLYYCTLQEKNDLGEE